MQSHLAYLYIKIFVLFVHTFCESLMKLCTTKHKFRPFLWYIFETWGSVSILQQKTVLEIKNLVTLRWFWMKYGISSIYFKFLYTLVYRLYRCAKDDDYNDKQTFNFLFLSDSWLYMVHLYGLSFRNSQK